MKKLINILFICGVMPLIFLSILISCTEDDTLNGSKELYITINPKDPFILVGDTVALRAHVSNLSGDTIKTPIKWTSDDESIVEIYKDSLVAKHGAQGKTTLIRATLQNGKYALSRVTVSRHVATGVTALQETRYSYNAPCDTVWFVVSPKEYLYDYDPVLENSNPELVIPSDNPIYINKETGMVGYAFSSKNTYGKAKVSLTLDNGGTFKDETQVVISPSIISSLGDDFNLITLEKGMTMDINKLDTVWVNTKVDPNYEVDLANAEKAYVWNVEGNAAQMYDIGVKVAKDRGHRAYLVLRSGKYTGQTIVKFECNGTTLTTTVDVQDYANQYPVDTLKVDKTDLSFRMGKTVYITPTVIPMSSFGMHVPVFTPVDPTIVQILGYNGNEMAIKGLEVGETDIIITSNDKSVTVHVSVLENLNIILKPGNQSHIFVGQKTQWQADVQTATGEVYIPSWRSYNENIATVDNDGFILGVSSGKAPIVAEADGVLSKPDTINVMAVPSQDVVYNNNNTNIDGNASYIDNDVLIIRMSPTGIPFEFFEIQISPNTPISDVVNATYTSSNSSIVAVANGSAVNNVTGTITISNGEESDMKTINGELTLTIGTNSFKVVINNLSTWL